MLVLLYYYWPHISRQLGLSSREKASAPALEEDAIADLKQDLSRSSQHKATSSYRCATW